MTSRMPVGEIISGLMLDGSARYEFMLLNGRMPTDEEFAEFRPKYEACEKAGGFCVQEAACPACGHVRGEDGDW